MSQYTLLGTLRYPNYQHEPFLGTSTSFDRHRLARGGPTGRGSPGSSPGSLVVSWRRSQPKCCQTGIPSSTGRPCPASGQGCRDVGSRLHAWTPGAAAVGPCRSYKRHCKTHVGDVGAARSLRYDLVREDARLGRKVTVGQGFLACKAGLSLLTSLECSAFQRRMRSTGASVLEQLRSSSSSKDVWKTLYPIRQFAISIAKCFPFIPWHPSSI